MNDRIEEIRERLYPITGYEFEACFPNMVRQKNNDPAIRPLIFARDCAAPVFIANAPADIAWLLDEVERLERAKAEAWEQGARTAFYSDHRGSDSREGRTAFTDHDWRNPYRTAK